jgi:glutamate synthase (NADPH) small chain
VIIGGGDTGADCLGTAHRQGALSVHQLEIMPRPPDLRDPSTPWPLWPLMFRTSSAHEEGGERVFAVNTSYFADDGSGHVAGLHLHEVELQMVEGRPNFVKIDETDFDLPADLVLLALGFAGPSPSPLFDQLGVSLTPRGVVGRDDTWKTNVDGVYVCGDMGRGQSLIVWAIAEGRSAAAAVDTYLSPDGRTELPAPVHPGALPLTPAG